MSSPAPTPKPQLNPDAKGLVGQIVSERYRIDALLGEGGMGAVYRGEQILMRKPVAIKVLHTEMMQLTEVVERFEREAMAAGRIDHPNVIAATDFGKLPNGSFFLVLEYADGKNLREILFDQTRLPPERAVPIFGQVLSALARAHSLGIIHRDLKPENVMLVERDGNPDFVKVLDFGIAKVPVGDLAKQDAKAQALTQLGMVYGTPEYMAPEQALGQPVDARADLYAAGVMLFEMLTGRRPFDAEDKVQILGMVVSQPVPAYATIFPGHNIPVELENFNRRLLEKLAKDRFADARSALEALEAACPSDLFAPPTAVTSMRTMRGSLNSVPRTSMPEQPAPGALAGPAEAVTNIMARPGSEGLAEGGSKIMAPIDLPGPLANLPPTVRTPAALGGIGFGVLLLLIAVVLLIIPSGNHDNTAGTASSASASSSAPAAPPSLSDEKLKEAADTGIEALQALRQLFPDDPKLLRTLAMAQLTAKQYSGAAETLPELQRVNAEELAKDKALKDELVTAAVQDSSDVLFAVFEGKIGSLGPDVLYDLSLKTGPQLKIAKKASTSLDKPETKALMSPALKLVFDLKDTGKLAANQACDERKKLFKVAKDVGDMRLMPQLNVFTNTKCKGSGWFAKEKDCFPCLRDGSLTEAIKAIQGRAKELNLKCQVEGLQTPRQTQRLAPNSEKMHLFSQNTKTLWGMIHTSTLNQHRTIPWQPNRLVLIEY